MAIDAGTVVAFMELDTSRFTSGLSSAGQQMQQFMNSNNSAETRIQSLGGAMQSVGSTATTALTLPLVGVGAAAVKTSMDFEAQMSKVQAISGATGNNFNKLREQAIKLGADTAFSASEAAAGQENLASAGFSVNEIMSAMPGMLSLAAAGDVDIATASDIAGSSLRGFGLEASQATHVADVLAKTAADTNAGITDTGEAMKYIAPVAHSLGISFEDTTAAIGLMSNAGIKGSQAGTTLRGALTNLAAPTKAASKTMEELKMNFFDAHGKMLPLGDVIQQLKDKTANLTQQQKASTMETLFGKEAMSGMLALVDQGPDKFRNLEKGLKNCDGAGKEMANTMQNNLKGSIEAMKGSIETMGIRIGDVLAPGIRKAADFIGNLADKFSNLPKPIQTAIVYIGLMVAAFGPVMIIFGKVITSTATVISTLGKLGSAVSSVSKIFGGLRTAANVFTILPGLISPPVLIAVAIIAGLGLIVYEVIKHWDQVKSAAQKFGNGVKNVFAGIGDYFHKSVEGWKKFFANPGDFFPVGKWIEAGGHMVDGLAKGLGEKIASAKDSVKKLGSNIKDTFASRLEIHSPSRVFAEYGVFIMQGLIKGFDNTFPDVTRKTERIGDSIKNTVKSVFGIHSPSRVFNEYGVFIMQGLMDGIFHSENKVLTTVSNLANGIKTRFSNLLEIHSPSKVFYEFGKNINEGLANSLKDNANLPKNELTAAVKSMNESIDDLHTIDVTMKAGSMSGQKIEMGSWAQKYYGKVSGKTEETSDKEFIDMKKGTQAINTLQQMTTAAKLFFGMFKAGMITAAAGFQKFIYDTTGAKINIFGLKDAIGSFASSTVSVLGDFFYKSGIGWSQTIEKVTGCRINVTGLKSVFNEFISDSVNGIGNLGLSLANFMNGLQKNVDKALEIGKNIINGLANGLKFLSPVTNVLKFIADAIIDYFMVVFDIHSPSKVFYNFGVFMMQGLVNGMRSMVKSIGNIISGIGNSIKDTFKSILGINSPSRVFDEFGVNTGQGYINGIDKMQSPIKSRFETLSNGIKNLGNAKPNFSGLSGLNDAVSGIYSSQNNKITNNNSNQASLLFNPNIDVHVTVSDVGDKGESELTNTLKDVTHNAVKNGIVEEFLKDAYRL